MHFKCWTGRVQVTADVSIPPGPMFQTDGFAFIHKARRSALRSLSQAAGRGLSAPHPDIRNVATQESLAAHAVSAANDDSGNGGGVGFQASCVCSGLWSQAMRRG